MAILQVGNTLGLDKRRRYNMTTFHGLLYDWHLDILITYSTYRGSLSCICYQFPILAAHVSAAIIPATDGDETSSPQSMVVLNPWLPRLLGRTFVPMNLIILVTILVTILADLVIGVIPRRKISAVLIQCLLADLVQVLTQLQPSLRR
jgi:hypothetical protein